MVRIGKKNGILNHMSRLEIGEDPIWIDIDELSYAHLFLVVASLIEFVEIVHFLEEWKVVEDLLEKKKKILEMKASPFTLMMGFYIIQDLMIS